MYFDHIFDTDPDRNSGDALTKRISIILYISQYMLHTCNVMALHYYTIGELLIIDEQKLAG